ncbi:hypothetical protein [Hoylesella nanceiensis]|uniref:hypothetical protein n=1 Tax=Hoylesella nanceiensis TaxID=425941 RepID=UPI001CAE5B1F|nr:hypothetical protein [Hoylesella nanceiensis]MBF1421912.1 hypothetical protein [Hoylesella nanceiensis]
MEIKLSAGDKIQIPTGCKATIEDNLIIIEKQKEEFKSGDVLHSKITDIVVIFSHYTRDDKHIFGSYFDSINDPNTGWFTEKFRHATEEEKQAFFDELKEQGLRWNAETKQMEKIRERVKYGKSYLYIDKKCKVVEVHDNRDAIDNANWEIGNYYRINEIEQAEEDAKAIRAIFEKRLKVK